QGIDLTRRAVLEDGQQVDVGDAWGTHVADLVDGYNAFRPFEAADDAVDSLLVEGGRRRSRGVAQAHPSPAPASPPRGHGRWSPVHVPPHRTPPSNASRPPPSCIAARLSCIARTSWSMPL